MLVQHFWLWLAPPITSEYKFPFLNYHEKMLLFYTWHNEYLEKHNTKIGLNMHKS